VATEKLYKEAESFLVTLFSLHRTRQLYTPSHPTYIEALKPVMENLGKILYVYAEATFLIVEQEFIFDGEPLLRTLPHIREFADVFGKFRIERFIFFPDVTGEEITSLITLLCSRPDRVKKEGGFDKIHETYHLTHILLERLPKPSEDGVLVSEYTTGGGAGSGEGEGFGFGILAPTIRKQYRTLYDNTNTILKELAKGEGGDLTILAGQVDHAVDDLIEHIHDFVETFNTKRTHFGDLDHEINSCLLAIGFAKTIGLDLAMINEIALAVLLNDIGVMFLPIEMQHKPVHLLTPKEKEQYKNHPLRGAEYLVTLQNVTPLNVIVCYEHHIGYDKKGFPPVGRNFQPHDASLLVNIVDKYELLARSSEIHKEAKDYIDEIKPLRGAEFEPRLFDLFTSFIREEWTN